MALSKPPAGYLVDTGVWVELERGRISAADLANLFGKSPVYGSPVSVAELTEGVLYTSEQQVRKRRLASVTRLLERVILPIDGATGEIFGQLAFDLVKQGRGSPSHRVQDLWIAAQAIQHKLRLITYNRKDFDDVPGLDLQVLRHERAP